ncbi:MAG TPA: PBECR2 nuclease fold domain-containing protein [Spirochaetia bacterium]|nr:PBECR2 nuclease fold domain-containing protein [Spirochaetia bacterium]
MARNERKLIIDTIDFSGKRVVFTEKKLGQKAIVHAELQKTSFIKRIEETLINPVEVWQDYNDPKNKWCYFRRCSAYSYAKVVVYRKGNPYEVVTAFEVNYIREQKYCGLKQIR